ncbi:MAG: hypothetical protein ABFD92_21270 [Planctomycetaceae bacterium]
MTIQSTGNITLTTLAGAPDADGDFIPLGDFSEAGIVVEGPLSCGELQELKAQWEQLFKGSSIATVTILELGK